MTTRIVVMGVAGSGKTTIGERLASRFGTRFLDADTAHPASNVAKMSAGTALSDADRWPWLARLRRELADADEIVVTCSALKRRYRDLLRRAGSVRFVFLDLDRDAVLQRVAGRTDHFMGATMVDGQFADLERPTGDETDVASVLADGDVDRVVDDAARALADLTPPDPAPLLADGGPRRDVTADELTAHVEQVVRSEILGRDVRRILLVPPDHTRLHSRAGEITADLYELLEAEGCEVAVLPALGTHAPMTPDDTGLLFGDRIPHDRILRHDWRTGLVSLGEIGAAEIEVVSRGRFVEPIPVEIDGVLLDGWDLVVSVGQVLPHEVIGMANFTKNVVIGLGGAGTIHRSHFLGAVSDMERVMGRASSPVREVVDAAFDRFVASRVDVLWMLTVMENTPAGVVQRGMYVGRGTTGESGGAAYRAAAGLSARVNVVEVDHALHRVSCWLDPREFRTTWVGNKAIYRTRMAIADGGELIVLAPGVTRFGEDDGIDRLIRRHGYRGTAAVLSALDEDPELRASLGAAAHLVHGSSEGRFRIVYCTDPDAGGLTRAEVEGVGFEWRPLPAELERLGVDGDTPSGPRTDARAMPFEHIAGPALGLWATSARLTPARA